MSSYVVTGPGVEHQAANSVTAFAWAREYLRQRPSGGYIMELDEVGLATRQTFVPPGGVGEAEEQSARMTHPNEPPLSAATGAAQSAIRVPSWQRRTDVPRVASADFSIYWHTREADPAPFMEIDGFRFRRTATMAGIETPSDVGGWIRWWIAPDDTPPYVAASLTDDMANAIVLGKLAAGSPGAKLLEQQAPDAVALARYGAGRIDGVDIVALHIPIEPVCTVLVSPLSGAPAEPLGRSWVEASLPAVNVAHRVTQACGDLNVALSRLSEREQEQLSRSPQTEWRAQLRQAADVSKDAKAILDLIKTVGEMFPA